MEEGRREPDSGFRVSMGVHVGCKKQRRPKDDSGDCVLSDSYNGEDHGRSRLGCDMQEFRKREFDCLGMLCGHFLERKNSGWQGKLGFSR